MTKNIDDLIPFFDNTTIAALKNCGYHEIWDEQWECIEKCVYNGMNTFISLPTGTGKTFPALLAIINTVLKHNGKAIYVVPLKALARQKYEHFSKIFSSLGITIGISTGDYAKHEYTNLGEKNVIIVTNEKLESLMRHNESFLSEVSLFVIDEIQMVEDSSRGLTLEIAVSEIIRKYNSSQIIGLSAVIGNPDDFGRWMTAEVISKEERKIPLKKGILSYNGCLKFNDKTNLQIYLRKDLFNKYSVPRTDQEKSTRYSNSIDLVKHLIYRGEQCIVFTNGRKHAEKLASALASDIKSGGYSFDKEKTEQLSRDIDEAIEEKTQFSNKLLGCTRYGVSFHHAGIDFIQREQIENAFLDGTLKVLVATPTLEQGVNLPAKTVIISDITLWNPSNREYSPLPINTVLNMMGRAGRPGFHEKGKAILVEDCFTDGSLHSKYAVKPPQKVLSQLRTTKNRRKHLNGLIASNNFIIKEDVYGYFKKTFWYTLFEDKFGNFDLKSSIDEDLKYLTDNGFVETIEEIIISTEFGKIVSDCCIDCETALLFRNISTKIIEKSHNLEVIEPWPVFQILLSSPHVVNKVYNTNYLGEQIAARKHKLSFVDVPSTEEERREFFKVALLSEIFEKWIEEYQLKDLLDYDEGIDEADIYSCGETIEWLGDAFVKILAIENIPKEFTDQILTYCDRAVWGVKAELLEYFKIKGIKRKSARNLFEQKYVYAALEGLSHGTLSKIVGPYVSKIIREHFEKTTAEKELIFEEKELYKEVEQVIEENHQIRYVLEDHKPTIGIITALTEEYASMKCLIDDVRKFDYVNQRFAKYDIGKIPTNSGQTHSLILALAGMGNNNSTSQAILMIERFPSIKYILMVGIAGGVPYVEIPDECVRLGDIVISSEMGIIQYDLIKEDENKIEYRPFPRPPHPGLIEIARHLEADEMLGECPWTKYIEYQLKERKLNRPPEDKDTLPSTTDPVDKKRVKGQPRVFIGPIASGNRVLKNSKYRDELRDKFKVKAIEMEGAGVADAAWKGNIGYLVIRGICDYCDSNKSDVWHDYATIVAAAYAKALIEKIPIIS